MRILQIETFGKGGLAHYVDNLSRALAARGHDVVVATAVGYELRNGPPRPPSMRVVEVIGKVPESGGTADPGLGTRLMRKLRAVRDALEVARTARRLRPEAIHLHCTNPVAGVYLALLRPLGIPLVYTAHVVTPHEPIPFQKAVYGFINRTPDRVVAHSRFDRSRLLDEFSVEPERVRVVPHGEYGFMADLGSAPDRAAARASLDLATTDVLALFFGYIREYKGLDVLLDAWPTVAHALSHARLLVAGDPVQLPEERRSQLMAQADRVGARHHFGYVPLPDVSRYFIAADVLVMPYRHISQSGVLFLALSLGTPVVATTVGGLPELLDDGVNALLVPPEHPEALAEALIRVLGDEALRTRLSEGGRQVADRHSWGTIAATTEVLLMELGRSRGAAADV